MIYDLVDYTTGLGHLTTQPSGIWNYTASQTHRACLHFHLDGETELLGVKQSYPLHFLCILTHMKKTKQKLHRTKTKLAHF